MFTARNLFTIIVLVLSFTTAAFASQPMVLQPNYGPIHTKVTLTAEALPANSTVDILWQSYDVDWDLSQEDGVYSGIFNGRTINETINPIGQAVIDAKGILNTSITIPDDIGGNHTIFIAKENKILAQGSFRTDMSAKVYPSSGPLGSPITIEVKGMWTAHNINGWYQVLYDNHETGLITAVTTKGTAKFTIPATGKVGKHVIELQNAPFGSPYRAVETSPHPYMPAPMFTFEITPGPPVLPPPLEEQYPPTQFRTERPASTDKSVVWVDVDRAAVGTPMVVSGENLPAGKVIALKLYTKEGSRVTAAGYTEIIREWTEVTTDDSGSFTLETAMPNALGGIHKLVAMVGDDELAATHFAVAPTAFPLQPAEGPVGTQFTMYLNGIGWSQTENIFGINYDNSTIGYACGFSTGGEVLVFLRATGDPGWHFIDIYPSYYRNKDYSAADEQPFMYRFPILTWKEDHPTPVHYRFAFKVTEE